jgi:type II secretory pathway pseudopilin PulG
MARYRVPRRDGLTLISLLVVLAILAMLLALLLPAVSRVRTAANRTQSMNNLKQLALALHSVQDVYKKLPPAVGNFPAQTNDKRGTLFFHILPFIEQNNLYRQAQGDVTTNGTYSTRIPVFENLEDKTTPPDGLYKGFLATSGYAANWMVFRHTDGGTASIPRTFRDGTSNTMVFAERYQMCHGHPCAWGYSSLYYWAPMFAYYSKGKFQSAPSQDACDPALPQSTDPLGILVALGDASVRTVFDQISPQTWWFATDPSDGMILGPDW